MIGMAKRQGKKPAESTGKPDEDKPPAVFFRPSPELNAALVAFIEAQPVRPERPAVAVTALEQFLAKHGFWPTKS